MLICCTDIEAFQTYTIARMDKKFLDRCIEFINTIISLNPPPGGRMARGLPGLPRFPQYWSSRVTICWNRSLGAFGDMCKVLSSKAHVNCRQLIETSYRLAQSDISQPPIVIDNTVLSGSQSHRLVNISYL